MVLSFLSVTPFEAATETLLNRANARDDDDAMMATDGSWAGYGVEREY